jgi:hypothetical protein
MIELAWEKSTEKGFASAAAGASPRAGHCDDDTTEWWIDAARHGIDAVPV